MEKCVMCGGNVSPVIGNVHEAGEPYHWKCFLISHGIPRKYRRYRKGTAPPKKVIAYCKKFKLGVYSCLEEGM